MDKYLSNKYWNKPVGLGANLTLVSLVQVRIETKLYLISFILNIIDTFWNKYIETSNLDIFEFTVFHDKFNRKKIFIRWIISQFILCWYINYIIWQSYQLLEMKMSFFRVASNWIFLEYWKSIHNQLVSFSFPTIDEYYLCFQ